MGNSDNRLFWKKNIRFVFGVTTVLTFMYAVAYGMFNEYAVIFKFPLVSQAKTMLIISMLCFYTFFRLHADIEDSKELFKAKWFVPACLMIFLAYLLWQDEIYLQGLRIKVDDCESKVKEQVKALSSNKPRKDSAQIQWYRFPRPVKCDLYLIDDKTFYIHIGHLKPRGYYLFYREDDTINIKDELEQRISGTVNEIKAVKKNWYYITTERRARQ